MKPTQTQQQSSHSFPLGLNPVIRSRSPFKEPTEPDTMATPQSTTDGPQAKKNLEQISFRFCSECSNMLYPKEDPDAHKLQFTCRTCQFTEEANSTCVFRNVLNNAAGETAGVTQDVGSDPTVGCPAFVSLCSIVPPALCLACGEILVCGLCRREPAALSKIDENYRSRDGLPICHARINEMDHGEDFMSDISLGHIAAQDTDWAYVDDEFDLGDDFDDFVDASRDDAPT
jgi:DNA-directed RNA polymerase subunit M/transcription elongation factor TFIIS